MINGSYLQKKSKLGKKKNKFRFDQKFDHKFHLSKDVTSFNFLTKTFGNKLKKNLKNGYYKRN